VRLATALACLAAAATWARAEPLAALLAGVAERAGFARTTRADLHLERGTASADAVLLGRGHVVYLETRDGTRALVRAGKVVARTGRRVARAAPGTALAGSDLLLEDLAPFTPWLLKVPQVSDSGPDGVVVTGAPAGASARALVVLTIDPERHLVLRTKYYEGSVSDLAAFRRDDDFTVVDGRERPTRIVVDGLRDRTRTTVTLAWRAADVPPEVFTPAALRHPSPLAW
jgi:hypothetical protein